VKLVCGLGNPGERYARTRHNVGFRAVEAFGQQCSASWTERWQARNARVTVEGEDVLLLMPMTFMNLSGHAVSQAARYFRIPVTEMLVIHDDADLPLGRTQFKVGGGDNGHRGVRSVMEQLGTRDVARIRIGVGRPGRAGEDMVDHVLSPFSQQEEEALATSLQATVEGIRDWVLGGVPRAQNRMNRRVRPDRPSCPEGISDGPQVQKEVE